MKKTTILFIFFAVNFSGCMESEKVKEKETIKVKTTEAIRVDYTQKIRASGVLSSKKEARLSFKTGGIIEKIHVDEGDFVQEGDIIASLNLREINAKVKQAMLSVEKAQRDLKRVENLYNDTVATLEQVQNAKTALDYAKTNYEIAQFNRQYSKIEAPANGKILKRLVEENELIAAGYPVVLMASTEKDWIVRSNLADVDVINIQIGDSAAIYFDAFKNQVFSAEVSEISGTADPHTGTFETEMRLIDPPKEIISGMIAKLYIFSSKEIELLQIPADALIEGNESIAYIYVLKDNKPMKRKVVVFDMREDYLYIESGLNAKEEVIVDGVNYIKPDSDVEVVE